MAAAATAAEEMRWAVDRLAGVPDPAREAWELWAAVSGRTLADAWLRRDHVSPQRLRAPYREAVARRAVGEPLAYVVRRAAFRLLELRMDRRVLIPRPETEGLVEHVLRWAHARWGDAEWGEVLDVGTGSGCIALSLAAEGRFRRVVGVDLSEEALAVARINLTAAARPVRSKVQLVRGDLFPAEPARFDALVSNPPYVTAREWDELPPDVRLFEPREALVSGDDGLHHTRALLRAARERLKPGGLVGMEIDSRRAEPVMALALEAGWPGARIEQDLFGKPRYLLATKEMA
ncbi:MAG TPA: peptide chain release factor N(5)-glutamine methyltransferase [Gemmatimonadales bacterium]|nr:peptide chain release factor N(5)-glutamine methyltransferase [Gemmatimonadales bacterium]